MEPRPSWTSFETSPTAALTLQAGNNRTARWSRLNRRFLGPIKPPDFLPAIISASASYTSTRRSYARQGRCRRGKYASHGSLNGLGIAARDVRRARAFARARSSAPAWRYSADGRPRRRSRRAAHARTYRHYHADAYWHWRYRAAYTRWMHNEHVRAGYPVRLRHSRTYMRADACHGCQRHRHW